MKRAIIVVSVLLVVAGCVSTPTSQIAAFGESSAALIEKVDAVMVEFNQATIERELTNYAATYKGTFAKQFSTEQLAKIIKPISPEQQHSLAIYRANKTLGDYALALAELDSANSRGDIDLASANLYGALTSFNSQYKAIKNSDKDLFEAEKLASVQSYMSAITTAIVAEKKRNALKHIVLTANPSIALICDEIIAQLQHAGLADGIAASRQYILEEQVVEYKLLAAKKSSKLTWRTKEMKRLWQLRQQVISANLVVQQSIKALLTIKETHQVLSDELSAGRVDGANIISAIGRLNEFNKHYYDFEQMLMSCTQVTQNVRGILSCEP